MGVAGFAQQDRLLGRWEGTVQSQRGSRPAVATFTRSGETYGGTISGVRPDVKLPFKQITGQSPTPRARRPSVPQPLQKQSLDYFVGQWNFRWIARESPLGSGSRKGTVTFTLAADGKFLDVRTEGQSDEGKYQESALVGFDEEKKMLAVFERRSRGIELLSLGDWGAAMTIRFSVSPVRIKNQTVRLKRTISVLSANSFRVSEEYSVDGGPFERLGDGTFTKVNG